MPEANNREVWVDQDSFALTLLTAFIDRYGTEGLAWDPTTIVMSIEEDYDIALQQLVHDRLTVGILLLTTDRFFKQLPDFIMFCNVLSGSTYSPEVWDPADSREIAWGLTEGLLINPPDEDEPFTEEIRHYIGATLDEEGIQQAPDLLGLALRDARLSFRNDYDAETTAAIARNEQANIAEINGMLRTNLRALMEQLESLHLHTGQIREVAKMLATANH